MNMFEEEDMRHDTSSTLTAALAAAGLLLATSGLAGQQMAGDRGTSFEVRAGTAIPGSDLADQFDPGFSAGVGLGFPLSERFAFALEGDVGFLSDITPDEEIGEDEAAQFFEGDMRLWHYGGALQFDLVDPRDSPVALVLHGGLGATTISPENVEVTLPGEDPVVEEAETETRFTANAGLGAGISMSERVDLFVDAKAYSIFVDDEDFEVEDIPEDQFGEAWWNFPVQVMLRFRMP